MKIFGLIGYPLTHSFSPNYFKKKWGIDFQKKYDYQLFPLATLSEFSKIIENEPLLSGLNVTIPYKTEIINHLNIIDEAAQKIGAVNTISFKNKQSTGHNTDYIGFQKMMLPYFKQRKNCNTLILGSGGAAKAVQYALENWGIDFKIVSRKSRPFQIAYEDLQESDFKKYSVIVNTTPLGMYPDVAAYPLLPYHLINENHLAVDLIYNPEKTIFLQKEEKQDAQIVNGQKMLEYQAEASWEIWQSTF